MPDKPMTVAELKEISRWREINRPSFVGAWLGRLIAEIYRLRRKCRRLRSELRNEIDTSSEFEIALGSSLTNTIAEVERIKACVQFHHDQRGDNRCHFDDLKLYHDALGIEPDPYVTALPPDPDMEESCRRYRQQRQCPAVAGTYPMPGGMTIQQLTDEVERLRAEVDAYRSVAAQLRHRYEAPDESPCETFASVDSLARGIVEQLQKANPDA